jgi:DNA invertase Pin-like site-specific DNA recombinase
MIGYARVSTTEQNLDLQRDALKRAGREKIIEDTVSGGKVQGSDSGDTHRLAGERKHGVPRTRQQATLVNVSTIHLPGSIPTAAW